MATEYPEHEKLKALKGKNQGMGYWIEQGISGYGDKQLEKILMAIIYLDDGEDTDEKRPNRNEAIHFINWFRDYKQKLKKSGQFFENRTNKILAAYYGIDEQKLDNEKRQMLADLGKAANV